MVEDDCKRQKMIVSGRRVGRVVGRDEPEVVTGQWWFRAVVVAGQWSGQGERCVWLTG